MHLVDRFSAGLKTILLFLAAYLLSAMDRTADPCTDFFQFACGAWNRKHIIPEDRSSISTFEVMADQLQIVLKGLLEEAPSEHDSEATSKAKHFYQSCMNISRCRISFTLFFELKFNI